MKKQVYAEAEEVLENHILVKDGNLEVIKDELGNYLISELTDHNLSVLILDTSFHPLRSYILFEFYDESDKASISSIIRTADIVKKTEESRENTINWRGQNLFSYYLPIKNDGKFYGVMVIAKPLTSYEENFKSLLVILASISILGFVGSFIIGYILSAKALLPLKRLSRFIERINFDKLDTYLPFEGNPQDEIYDLTKKFNDMLVRLKLMAQQQKDFISNVSHELKTPLTRAISSMELTGRSELADKNELNLIKSDLFEASRLIEKLLALASLRKKSSSAGDFINLLELINDLLKRFEKEIKEKKLRIRIKINKNYFIFFPKEYAYVLFSNIFTNAIKYNREGGEITVVSRTNKNKIIIVSIKDNGIGMNRKVVGNVFKRFYRGNKTKNKQSGVGVGMSLVKQICNLYGVKIEIDSEEGKGTTVHLAFGSGITLGNNRYK